MKISVALCTYNGEKYLEEQIESILNQTIPVNEIIVCDDCSTDSTISILNKYKDRYPDLFNIYINEINLRSNKNFEKAIGLASGDYIFLSDQDDLWRLDKVKTTINIFKTNPSAEGVFSNADFIDDYSNKIYQDLTLWWSVNFFEENIKSNSDLKKSLLYIGNFLTGATLCIKKQVKEFCFPFLTTKRFIHDEWFAYLLSNRNTLFYSNENLISYRLHSNQQLGVGKIKDTSYVLNHNLRFTKLIFGYIKPKTFKDYKVLIRSYFSQVEKYHGLSNKFSQFDFLKNRNILINVFLETQAKMKRSYPILYFIRKISDKRKGKRQIGKYL